MKLPVVIIVCLVPLSVMIPVEIYAIGGCPDRAENLEDFAGCLAPVPASIGMRYRGVALDLDPAHQSLLASMSGPMATPAVYPISSPFYSYYPYSPIASSMMYWISYGAYLGRRGNHW